MKSIYDISYKGIEDKLVIINEYCPKQLLRAREHIEFAGFSLEDGNYTSFQSYTKADEVLLGKLPFVHDSLTGVSTFYSKGIAGWKMYGREEGRIRIMILGGSTTSEEYHVQNWAKRMYNKLNRMNIKVTIYNGAYPG